MKRPVMRGGLILNENQRPPKVPQGQPVERHAPVQEPKTEPVHEHEKEWYFWDEAWTDRHGPYATKAEAEVGLKLYAFYLETGINVQEAIEKASEEAYRAGSSNLPLRIQNDGWLSFRYRRAPLYTLKPKE